MRDDAASVTAFIAPDRFCSASSDVKRVTSRALAAAAATAAVSVRSPPSNQGQTLVHFSAQPEPFLTQTVP